MLLDDLGRHIAEAARRVECTAGEELDARLLTTIPGISYLSALTIMGEIGAIGRFPSAKKLIYRAPARCLVMCCLDEYPAQGG